MDDELTITEDTPEETPDAPATSSVAPPEILNVTLGDYFNIESPSAKNTEMFEDIAAYFGDRPEGAGELIFMLRELESRLGEPRLGDTRLSQVHRYIRAAQSVKDSKREMDSMLR